MKVEVMQLPWKPSREPARNDIVIRDSTGFEVCHGWHFLRAEHGSRIAVLAHSGAMFNLLERCRDWLDPEMTRGSIVTLREDILKLLNEVERTATNFAGSE